jgi:DNA-binding transcriptional regulator YiaG
MTFHGSRPTKDHEVAHWNGDSSDNRASNLRWATRPENKADELRHGTRCDGVSHGMAKLTEKDVLTIRELRATTNMTLQVIAARFDISRTHAKRITLRKSWKCIP